MRVNIFSIRKEVKRGKRILLQKQVLLYGMTKNVTFYGHFKAIICHILYKGKI